MRPSGTLCRHPWPLAACGSRGGNMVGAKGPPLRHQRLSECWFTSSGVAKLRWGAEAKSGTGTLHVESPVAWLHSSTGTKRIWSPNLGTKLDGSATGWEKYHSSLSILWTSLNLGHSQNIPKPRDNAAKNSASWSLLQGSCHYSFVLNGRHAACRV